MPRRFIALFRAVVIAAILAVCTPVSAQTDPHSPEAEAESRYQTAVRLFGEGRYREALDEFDAAIALSPESIFYCNRAIVLIQLREPLEALDSLETCQQTFTGSEAELAGIDAQRAAVASVVHVLRPGALDTVSAMNAPDVPEPSRGWNRATTGYILLGIGGALAASAATLDRLSVDLKEDLATTADGRSVDDYNAAKAAYVTRRRIWIGLSAGGAAFIVTGGILVVSWLVAKPEPNVAIGIQPVKRGVFLRFRW